MKKERLDDLKTSARWKAAAAARDNDLRELEGQLSAVRMCPFCWHRLALAGPGIYYPEVVKCPACGEVVVLPKLVVSQEAPKIITDEDGYIIGIEE